jgi:hypothetical protein
MRRACAFGALQRSKSPALWGVADAVGALPSLLLMTHIRTGAGPLSNRPEGLGTVRFQYRVSTDIALPDSRGL